MPRRRRATASRSARCWRASCRRTGTVLEIASGSGEHAVALRARVPGADLAAERSRSDGARAASRRGAPRRSSPNLRRADRARRDRGAWPVERADAIVCINMVHIAPWEAALGAVRRCRRGCSRRARCSICTGRTGSAAVHRAVERGVRSRRCAQRDPRWGVRDVDELDAPRRARTAWRCARCVAMPANNHSLVFRVASAD